MDMLTEYDNVKYLYVSVRSCLIERVHELLESMEFSGTYCVSLSFSAEPDEKIALMFDPDVDDELLVLFKLAWEAMPQKG